MRAAKKRRLRAALALVEHRNAKALGLVGEVAGDAGAGKTMTPVGTMSSMRSLRLEGAALPSGVQSGLNAICVTPRVCKAIFRPL